MFCWWFAIHNRKIAGTILHLSAIYVDLDAGYSAYFDAGYSAYFDAGYSAYFWEFPICHNFASLYHKNVRKKINLVLQSLGISRCKWLRQNNTCLTKLRYIQFFLPLASFLIYRLDKDQNSSFLTSWPQYPNL